MTVWTRGHLTLALVVIAGGVACGNGTRDGGGTGNVPVVTIAKTVGGNGDAQTGPVGAVLPIALRVVVLEDGLPKLGQEVTWSVSVGGGSITLTDTTDASGFATASWTLGTLGGNQSAQATVPGAVGSPVTFGAVATPGAPAGLTKTGGDGQTTVVRLSLPVPLKVKVVDQYSNPVPGVTVNWDPTGPISLPATSVTDNKGEAQVSARAGNQPGTPTVLASVAGVVATPTFSFTVLPIAREITVGDFFFTSATNLTSNPAVDTVAVGETVLWTLVSGTHSVRSLGAPSFVSEGTTLGAEGFFVTFPAAGTYQYDCSIHGAAQMSGRVVVQ